MIYYSRQVLRGMLQVIINLPKIIGINIKLEDIKK